jgi:hypothetical protein
MKSIRLLLSIALFLVVTACCATPLLPPDVYEPNDTIDTAQELVGTINASINEGDNPDMYFFTLAAGQRAQFVLAWKSNTNSVRLELFGTSKDSLGSFYEVGFERSNPPSDLKFLTEPLQLEVVRAGRYMVSLTSFLTGCLPEIVCPTGRSSYSLRLEKGPLP